MVRVMDVVFVIVRYTLINRYHTIVSKRTNPYIIDLGCNDLCHQSKLNVQVLSLSFKPLEECCFGFFSHAEDLLPFVRVMLLKMLIIY